MTFVDIAGLVRGASQGEGLGNQFLAAIRETDAICQVVRAFHDDDVVHVDARVDPAGDIETVNTELILADLQTVENRLPALARRPGRPELKPAVDAVAAAERILGDGRTISEAAAKGEVDAALLRDLHLLTAKPFIYVFNVDEGALGDAALAERLAAERAARRRPIVLCAQIEAEVAALDADDAAELLRSYGQEESGLEQLVHVGFATLGLQTFLTAGPKEARAWTIHVGDTAPKAAGRHPHRLRAGIHQGRGDQLRRPHGGRARWRRPARPARRAWRARTTSCATATWWSSASTPECGQWSGYTRGGRRSAVSGRAEQLGARLTRTMA